MYLRIQADACVELCTLDKLFRLCSCPPSPTFCAIELPHKNRLLWHLETAFAAIDEEPTSPTLLAPSTSYLECHKDILRAKLTKAKCARRKLLGPLSEHHSISPRDDSAHEMGYEGIRCHVPPSSHLRGTHGERKYLLLVAVESSVEIWRKWGEAPNRPLQPHCACPSHEEAKGAWFITPTITYAGTHAPPPYIRICVPQRDDTAVKYYQVAISKIRFSARWKSTYK